jgi:hypothetical protein
MSTQHSAATYLRWRDEFMARARANASRLHLMTSPDWDIRASYELSIWAQVVVARELNHRALAARRAERGVA